MKTAEVEFALFPKAKLFAEARYDFVDTPPVTQTNVTGTAGSIPVTLGVLF